MGSMLSGVVRFYFPRFLKALSVERMFQRFSPHIYLLLVMRGHSCQHRLWSKAVSRSWAHLVQY